MMRAILIGGLAAALVLALPSPAWEAGGAAASDAKRFLVYATLDATVVDGRIVKLCGRFEFDDILSGAVAYGRRRENVAIEAADVAARYLDGARAGGMAVAVAHLGRRALLSTLDGARLETSRRSRQFRSTWIEETMVALAGCYDGEIDALAPFDLTAGAAIIGFAGAGGDTVLPLRRGAVDFAGPDAALCRAQLEPSDSGAAAAEGGEVVVAWCGRR